MILNAYGWRLRRFQSFVFPVPGNSYRVSGLAGKTASQGLFPGWIPVRQKLPLTGLQLFLDISNLNNKAAVDSGF
jgi:hypothetical protein